VFSWCKATLILNYWVQRYGRCEENRILIKSKYGETRPFLPDIDARSQDNLMAIYAYSSYTPRMTLIHLVGNSRRDISLFIFPGNITKISEGLVPSCYRILFQHIQAMFLHVAGSTFLHTGGMPMQLQGHFILSEPTCNETLISLQVIRIKVKR
jgi:hypothetical protein